MTTASLTTIRPLAAFLAAGLAITACTTNRHTTSEGPAEESTTRTAAIGAADPVAISTGAFVAGTTDNTAPIANASLAIESKIMSQAAEAHANTPGLGDSGNISQV